MFENISIIPAVIISALIGGIITLITTHQNYKSKKYELEYNYNCKMNEIYHSNARKYIDDIYKPLYQKLMEFDKYITLDVIENDNLNRHEFEVKFNNLLIFINGIENSGKTSFLTHNIDQLLTEYISFIDLSIKHSDEPAKYTLSHTYKIFGHKYTLYDESLTFGKKVMFIYSFMFFLFRLFYNFRFFNIFNSIIIDNYKIMLIHSKINSNEFKSHHINCIHKLKQNIKNVTLGLKSE